MTTIDEQVQSTQTEAEQGKYVYCIIKTEAPKNFGAVGIGGRGDKVYTGHYKEFGAVVSNCPQMNNPVNDYRPTPVRAIVYQP